MGRSSDAGSRATHLRRKRRSTQASSISGPGCPGQMTSHRSWKRRWHGSAGFAAASISEEDFVYGVFSEDESQVIGGAGLQTRVGDGAYEIGYWVHAGHVGRGIATAVASALTRVGIELGGADRIEIHVEAGNEISCRIPRRLGYVEEGTLRRRSPGRPASLGATQSSSRSLRRMCPRPRLLVFRSGRSTPGACRSRSPPADRLRLNRSSSGTGESLSSMGAPNPLEGARRLHARSGRHVRHDVLDAGDPAGALARLRRQPVARRPVDLGRRPRRCGRRDSSGGPSPIGSVVRGRSAWRACCSCRRRWGSRSRPDSRRSSSAATLQGLCMPGLLAVGAPVRRRGVRAADRGAGDGLLRVGARRRRPRREARRRSRERGRRVAGGDRRCSPCFPLVAAIAMRGGLPEPVCPRAEAGSAGISETPGLLGVSIGGGRAVLHVRRRVHVRRPTVSKSRRSRTRWPPRAWSSCSG